MSLPTITMTGRLTADPELRFAPSGTAVAKIRLAANSRRKDERGEWVDADVLYLDATAFGDLAEHCAESLTKGMEVIATGRIRTEQWETDGQKRSAVRLLLDGIGPSLRWATAAVTKASRDGAPVQRAPQPAAASAPWGAPSQTDTPPF